MTYEQSIYYIYLLELAPEIFALLQKLDLG